jgi:hypothetical protein
MEVKMTAVQFVCLAAIAGVPGALVQVWLYMLERRRQKKSLLWQAWASLQAELAQTLHHPHPESQEMDRLLERLQDFTLAGVSSISEVDRIRLTQLLRDKVDDPNQKKEERVRAEFLLFAMPRARK